MNNKKCKITYIILGCLLLILFPCFSCSQMEVSLRNAELYYKMGMTHFDKGDHNQAILYFNKALEFSLSYAEVNFIRGRVFSNKKEYDQAISNYAKVINLNQKYVGACNLLERVMGGRIQKDLL